MNQLIARYNHQLSQNLLAKAQERDNEEWYKKEIEKSYEELEKLLRRGK